MVGALELRSLADFNDIDIRCGAQTPFDGAREFLACPEPTPAASLGLTIPTALMTTCSGFFDGVDAGRCYKHRTHLGVSWHWTVYGRADHGDAESLDEAQRQFKEAWERK